MYNLYALGPRGALHPRARAYIPARTRRGRVIIDLYIAWRQAVLLAIFGSQ